MPASNGWVPRSHLTSRCSGTGHCSSSASSLRARLACLGSGTAGTCRRAGSLAYSAPDPTRVALFGRVCCSNRHPACRRQSCPNHGIGRLPSVSSECRIPNRMGRRRCGTWSDAGCRSPSQSLRARSASSPTAGRPARLCWWYPPARATAPCHVRVPRCRPVGLWRPRALLRLGVWMRCALLNSRRLMWGVVRGTHWRRHPCL